MRVKLGDVCERGTSNLKLLDVSEKNGEFSVFGASGYIGSVDFYQQGYPYVAVVKDGAGIGRAMLCPGKTSVIGTMQYLLPKDNILPKYLFYVVKYMNLEKYWLNHKFCGISDSSRSSVGSYRIASERNIRHQDIRIPVCEES